MTSRLPVFTVSLALASGLAGAEPLRTTVGRTDNAPKVDGRADACYAGAFPVSGFADIGTMAPAPEDTDVRFVHDGTRLYGFVTCEQKDAMKAAPSSPVRGDPNVWTGNSVELFFWTDDGIRYYAIGQFANCNWLVAHQDDANVWIRNHPPTSGLEVATHREDGRWFAEFSIPLSELGGGNLRLNIGRNVPGRQISAWQPFDGNGWWNENVAYGEFRLADGGLGAEVFSALPPFDPARDFVFAVTNAANEVVYRYEHVVPRPYVKMKPANLQGGPLYLDGEGKLQARLTWDSRHNYPGGDAHPDGKWVPVPVTLRFRVPSGVVIENGRRTGSTTVGDRTYDLYEQVSPRAYSQRHYIKTFVSCHLPVGTKGEIAYTTSFRDGEEPERVFPFEVTKVPEVLPPKRFITGYYHHFIESVEAADVWARSGVNTFAVRGYGDKAERLARELLAKGYKVRHGDYFWPGAKTNSGDFFNEWGRLDPAAQALDIGGKPIRNGNGYQLSPSYRGRLFDEAVAQEVDFQRKTGVNWCAFDMEGYIQRKGESGDFRPETMAAFRRNWERLHPSVPAPDPRVFELAPAKDPEAHRVFVETKCALWGGFFRDLKAAIAAGTGREVVFSEWSMNTIEGLEARNHSLRGADFFRAMDYVELDTYAGIDRDLRQIGLKLAWYRDNYPNTPLNVILTPAPHRLGLQYGPGTHYSTTAPAVTDENLCVFKEGLTMGVKGVYVFHANYADIDFIRQFAEGVNLLNRVEDLVMDGTSFELTSDHPSDAGISDRFFGKVETWYGQPRVFTRGISLGERTLISVSEYRELKAIDVNVNFSPKVRVRATDLETGEDLGTFGPETRKIPVRLAGDRRCRLVLLEPLP